MNKRLNIIELMLLIIAGGIGVFWMFHPEGSYEPFYAFSLFVIGGIGYYRKHSSQKTPAEKEEDNSVRYEYNHIYLDYIINSDGTSVGFWDREIKVNKGELKSLEFQECIYGEGAKLSDFVTEVSEFSAGRKVSIVPKREESGSYFADVVFDPPIKKGESFRYTITRKSGAGKFNLYRDQLTPLPKNWAFKGPIEHFSFTPWENNKKLVLSVKFPFGYNPVDKLGLEVYIGNSCNRNIEEYLRLNTPGRVEKRTKSNCTILTTCIENPKPHNTYYLKWLTLDR